MRNKTLFYMGLILTLIGGGALYNSLFLENYFAFSNLWPLFLLLPGLYMEIDYFSNHKKRDPGVLIPGGFLTLTGLYFLINEFMPFRDSITYPVFILILGIAILQYYIVKPRDRGLLVISIALILFGSFLIYAQLIGGFPMWFSFRTIRALAIMLLGLYLVARASKKEKKPDSTYRPRESYHQNSNPNKDAVVQNTDPSTNINTNTNTNTNTKEF